MSANQDLMADPLAFFQKNVVVVTGTPAASSDGPAEFSLIRGQDYDPGTAGTRTTTVLRRTVGANVYYFMPYNKQEDTKVKAYWCGYQDNSAQFQMLADRADLMMTARMDGCSFGVGSEADDGSRLVGHFNIQNRDGVAQEAEMRDVAQQFLGPDAAVLGKSAYKADNVFVTTFGFRKKGHWQFYHQRYRKLSLSDFHLIDVRPVTGNA